MITETLKGDARNFNRVLKYLFIINGFDKEEKSLEHKPECVLMVWKPHVPGFTFAVYLFIIDNNSIKLFVLNGSRCTGKNKLHRQ